MSNNEAMLVLRNALKSSSQNAEDPEADAATIAKALKQTCDLVLVEMSDGEDVT